MGSAYDPAPCWSLTRARLLRECPRAFFLKYLVRGEPEAERAAALKALAPLAVVAGQAVDRGIAHALAAWRDEGTLQTGLADEGERVLREAVARSPAAAKAVREGSLRRSGADPPPLIHDYYGYDVGREHVERMVTRVAECLHRFECGGLWLVLRGLGPQRWAPLVSLGESEVTHFLTPQGLRVYAAHDLALQTHDRMVYVLDWKSGRRSPRAEEEAQAQLAVYAAWAAREYRVPLEWVRTQAVWLQEPAGAEWLPESVPRERAKAVATRVLEEAAAEAARVEVRRSLRGVPIQATAHREAFPPRPDARRCLECPFRELCPEGQQECAHVGGHACG
jgi:CRISPR/Cas system-associated exonuclease Cas4 (RecB family)